MKNQKKMREKKTEKMEGKTRQDKVQEKVKRPFEKK